MRLCIFLIVMTLSNFMAGNVLALCSGKILLKDKFDDNLTGWVTDKNAKIDDGLFHITMKKGKSKQIYLPSFKFSPTKKSICIEINIRIKGNSDIGILYWSDKKDNSFHVSGVRLRDKTYHYVWKYDSGWTNIFDSKGGILPKDGDIVNISIVINENIVTYFYNDILIHKFRGIKPENKFRVGFGLGFAAESANNEYEIHDLTITTPVEKYPDVQDRAWKECNNNKVEWSKRAASCGFFVLAGNIDANDRIDALKREGDAYFEGKDFNIAILSYRKLIDVDPNNAYAKQRIEKIQDIQLAESGEIDKFTEDIVKDKNNLEAYDGRASTYYKYGKTELAVSDWVALIDVSRKVAKQAEESGGFAPFDVYSQGALLQISLNLPQIATAALQEKNYEKAVGHLTTLIRIFPDDIEYVEKPAVVFDKWGKKEEAIADYTTVIDIEPTRTISQEALRRLK